MKSEEILECLKFQKAMGITDMLAEQPINHFQTSQTDNYPPLEPQTQTQTQTEPKPETINNETKLTTKTIIRNCKNLEELRHALDNFEECTLKKTAQNTVFSDGNPTAKIMLIGEAPGAEEDQQGKPFVGHSGILLDKIFSYIGLTRENIYITNIVPWRPAGNRAPLEEEIETCRPFLERHIELINPKVIILAGNIVTKSLLKKTKTGIAKLHGVWHTYKMNNQEIPCFPIYHPDYLLRTPIRKAEIWKDCLSFAQDLSKKIK